MAFDGVTIACITSQIKNRVSGGRIYKISQPENDEICLVIKNKTDGENCTYRLVLSADASLPLIYFTNRLKENPAVAPGFCMLLRKHIGNGRIISIKQPGFERIVEFTIEHLDEMGDLCTKKLIIELMGKHSNIIFTDSDGNIIDSIKHISHQISSVREVLPGRKYEYPPAKDKINPLDTDVNYFMNHVMTKPETVCRGIVSSLNGISPVFANEICYRAGIDGSAPLASLSLDEKERLFLEFNKIMDLIKREEFEPCIAYSGYEPKEFAPLPLTGYGEYIDEVNENCKGVRLISDISEVIAEFYEKKSIINMVKQRSTDLRKIVSNAVTRTAKKYDLQLSQLKDTEKRDKYQLYGELITAYAYAIPEGEKNYSCEDYHTGEQVVIPLDETISPMENAKRYFSRYNKQKRTYEALIEQIVDTKNELEYLLTVPNSLDIADSEKDLKEIKEELVESGYIRGKHIKGKNTKKEKSRPMHFVSSDGYHIYVGKNNFQNEMPTFEVAGALDMWFHAKKMPGSHVIVKTEGDKELPDRTYEEAARLAAYFSTGRESKKVDVDYTIRKNLKKPPKAKPGFVIYHTNYSMTIEPDIHGIEKIE